MLRHWVKNGFIPAATRFRTSLNTMFNLFQKKATAKDFGHQMWLYCVNNAEQFCLDFRPQLQAAGYVRNPNEDRRFMDEAIHLHIWIIFCALGNDKSNDKALEEFNNYAMTFIMSQNARQVSIQERCKTYYQAYAKDMEVLQNGGTSMNMAITAIKCLIHINSQDLPAELVVIKMAMQIEVMGKLNIVCKIRKETNL